MFKIAAPLLALILYVGFIGPWLVSAPSTIAVLLGITLGITVAVWVIYTLRNFTTNHEESNS